MSIFKSSLLIPLLLTIIILMERKSNEENKQCPQCQQCPYILLVRYFIYAYYLIFVFCSFLPLVECVHHNVLAGVQIGFSITDWSNDFNRLTDFNRFKPIRFELRPPHMRFRFVYIHINTHNQNTYLGQNIYMRGSRFMVEKKVGRSVVFFF